MSKRRVSSSLFVRWFWLVYLPLGLLPSAIILRLFGVLPNGTTWIIIILGIWGLLAVRLLMERRRAGLGVPPPKSTVIGIGSIAAMTGVGALLLILGMGRLTTGQGLAMTAIGGFLMLVSVTVPTFRLMDSIIRGATRLLGRSKRG